MLKLKGWSNRGSHAVRTGYKRGTLLVIAAFLFITSTFAFMASTPSRALDISSGASLGQSVGGETISTCAIEQVGWVICPTMRTIAKLADYGFAFININYLKIEYEITANDSGTYKAWEQVRNIANILFVLVFLYIIYTQITGRNAGSYNIKRILPRLIVGAIFVNISYYLCAAVIQGSNIIGSIILNIMGEKGVAGQIGPAAISLENAANGFQDGVLTDLTSAILTKSGVVWVLMAPIAAVIISIAIVSAAGIVLLIARKVIVAMLVLVSPLLFVTYLLPNIEHYFKQWVRLFTQLLLIFPVIAFLLGAGQIISATIINVGSGGDSNYSIDDDNYQAKNGGSGSAMTDLAAAAAAVLPLLGVWFVMKGLSSVMTTAGSKIAAGVSRASGNKERTEKLQAKLGKPNLPSAAGNINIMGGKVNVFDRKPAFTRMTSRKRRAATAGGSARTLPAQKPGEPGRTPGTQTLASSLNNLMGSGDQKQNNQTSEMAEKLQELNNANIAAQQANVAGVQVAIAQAAVQSNGGGKNDGKSANQLLSELNKPRHEKSQGGGNGGPANAGSPPGRTNDYRAPVMTQPMSAPVQVSTKSGGGPMSVVAGGLPQVDASSLAQTGSGQGPTSEMEQKAKAHAQKYLFESAEEVEKAAKRQEELDQMSKDTAKDLGNDKKQGE